MFRVRGKVKKLLGDEEGALNDLTVAELLDYDTTVRNMLILVWIVILDNPSTNMNTPFIKLFKISKIAYETSIFISNVNSNLSIHGFIKCDPGQTFT